MKHTKRFSISPVSAAVALALGVALPSAAFAAGMPGAGTVVLGTGAGTTVTGLANGATIKVTAPTVIQWGGAKAPVDTTNIPGFNVLSGNTLNFTSGTKAAAPVLNVDASTNASVVAGTVKSAGNFFLANANGITVTPGAVISAPVVGLIGANLSTSDPTKATAAQIAFTKGSAVPVGFGTNGSVSVSGTINNAGAPADILIAGSGSVQVNATGFNYSGKTLSVFGGVGVDVLNTGAATGSFGTATSGVPAATAYAATAVSLTNAAPTQVFADGNLTFSGYSTLPASPNLGWSGVLKNDAGATLFTPSSIAGSGAKATQNPWYTVASTTGSGFTQGAVGSIDNEGLLQTVTSGLTTNSNGFTNNGTLRIGSGGNLVVTSGVGDINLAGTVQGTTSSAAIANAFLSVTKSGNINVSAPLTITASGTNPANFAATTAAGNVNISSAVAVTSNFSDDSGYNSSTTPARWYVSGDGVTISGAQTVKNSNGTTTKQPSAVIALNKSGGSVDITSTGSLTAGDILVGSTTNRAALTLDGTLTATNTGYTSSKNGGDVGSINIGATYIQNSATENMTAQQFNIDYTRWINKYKDRTASFAGNGLLITPVGSNPTLNLAETGSNLQNTNITAAGDLTVNANSTTVSFTPGAFLSGTYGAGTAPGNSGSNVIITSSGNLTLGGSSAPTTAPTGNGVGSTGSYASKYLGDSGTGSFWVPGLLYLANVNSATAPTGLSGTGSITALHDVYNDYLLPVAGGRGIFFGTGNLTVNGSLFTNMNSVVNFKTAAQRAQYQGMVYQVQYSPSNISNTLNVVPNSAATNVYSFNNF